MLVNLIYGVTHYGFGSVQVPEWYMENNERYLLEPMPVIPFISYWIKRGLTFSFIYGGLAFILVFISKMVIDKKRKTVEQE